MKKINVNLSPLVSALIACGAKGKGSIDNCVVRVSHRYRMPSFTPGAWTINGTECADLAIPEGLMRSSVDHAEWSRALVYAAVRAIAGIKTSWYTSESVVEALALAGLSIVGEGASRTLTGEVNPSIAALVPVRDAAWMKQSKKAKALAKHECDACGFTFYTSAKNSADGMVCKCGKKFDYSVFRPVSRAEVRADA